MDSKGKLKSLLKILILKRRIWGGAKSTIKLIIRKLSGKKHYYSRSLIV